MGCFVVPLAKNKMVGRLFFFCIGPFSRDIYVKHHRLEASSILDYPEAHSSDPIKVKSLELRIVVVVV